MFLFANTSFWRGNWPLYFFNIDFVTSLRPTVQSFFTFSERYLINPSEVTLLGTHFSISPQRMPLNALNSHKSRVLSNELPISSLYSKTCFNCGSVRYCKSDFGFRTSHFLNSMLG